MKGSVLLAVTDPFFYVKKNECGVRSYKHQKIPLSHNPRGFFDSKNYQSKYSSSPQLVSGGAAGYCLRVR